jgi:hypothetical protein
MADLVAEDGRPPGLPDEVVIGHEDIAATLCGGFGATEMVGERCVRAV